MLLIGSMHVFSHWILKRMRRIMFAHRMPLHWPINSATSLYLFNHAQWKIFLGLPNLKTLADFLFDSVIKVAAWWGGGSCSIRSSMDQLLYHGLFWSASCYSELLQELSVVHPLHDRTTMSEWYSPYCKFPAGWVQTRKVNLDNAIPPIAARHAAISSPNSNDDLPGRLHSQY